MRWTKEEVALLYQMRAEGMLLREIAEKLGRGKNSVIGKMHRIREGGGLGTPAPCELIALRNRKMRADCIGGMTHAEIAVKYGLSRSTVSKIMSQSGLTLTKKERVKRMQAGRKASPHKQGRLGIPAGLQNDYRTIRNCGFTPPEAKKMLGLVA